jgi:26S proteasome regulatory subunit N6
MATAVVLLPPSDISEENALKMARGFAEQKDHVNLKQLIVETRPFLLQVSKAKAAKMVRTLIDLYLDMEAHTGVEIDLCKECIEWARTEKRIFLRQSLQARLVELYFSFGQYQDGIVLATKLLDELKKVDDKSLLVEVFLQESRIYHALNNISKSRASLTSARTTVTTIYCPPKLQAQLDLQSGIIHASEEKDFKTAYSYFYEAFEGFDSISSPHALKALIYMLLCKIIMNKAEEVKTIVTGKLALKYNGRELEAIKQIALAYYEKQLLTYKNHVEKFSDVFANDIIITSHLSKLYDRLLQQNLLRIVEPYSTIQVEKVARLMELPFVEIEKKISQMILDGTLRGTIDQGTGVLELFQLHHKDKTYETTLETVQSLDKVMTSLYERSKKLTYLN